MLALLFSFLVIDPAGFHVLLCGSRADLRYRNLHLIKAIICTLNRYMNDKLRLPRSKGRMARNAQAEANFFPGFQAISNIAQVVIHTFRRYTPSRLDLKVFRERLKK